MCIFVNTFMTVKMNSHPCLVMQEFQNKQQNFLRLANTSRTMQTARSVVEKTSIERHIMKQLVYWQLYLTVPNIACSFRTIVNKCRILGCKSVCCVQYARANIMGQEGSSSGEKIKEDFLYEALGTV